MANFSFRLIVAVAYLGAICCAGQSLVGQEFKIDSQVYGEGSTEPASHNVTIFTEKLVCDFRMSNDTDPKPVETVVYDKRERLLVLLDSQREVRVEVSDLQLIKLVDGLRRQTLQNERAKFLITEQFVEDSDWTANGWVSLKSPSITYRFKGTQPQDVTILPEYLDFLDHFTRLNASDPSKFPPFPRMRLNRSIKKLGWIPTEVQFEVKANSLFAKPFKASSKHVLTEGLTDRDREMVEEAKRLWMRLPNVELPAYRGIELPKKTLVARKETEPVTEKK